MSAESDEFRHPSGRPMLFHERIAKTARDHPERTEYWIHTESTASALILSIAAALKLMGDQMEAGDDRTQVRDMARKYRHAVARGVSLETLRGTLEEGPLTFCGLAIKVPPQDVCDRWPAGLEYIPDAADRELVDSIALATEQSRNE